MDKIDKRTKEYRDSVVVPDSEMNEVGSVGELMAELAVESDPPTVSSSPDFNHCPGCGAELLEDERSSKCVAHCKKCIWENL